VLEKGGAAVDRERRLVCCADGEGTLTADVVSLTAPAKRAEKSAG
jgi:hypothetical protein